MESIIARALEYTLKYWLKSFTRDQFKLQGHTAQLSNLDINGDALHASLGLPPALTVTTAKVGKLEIVLPYVSNIQVEPIVVQIDKLDVVLEENDDVDASRSTSSTPSPTSAAKGSGYGFADKIADGMTLEVGTVNFLLETHGGARRRGGATWASPMASITIRNLLLYTTNESWQVVNLKEAREFSSPEKFIYVFKKLEWEYLSIDLLPHPDMFAHFANSDGASNKKDDDGAKRVFFGGERFIEGVSGEAYITIQRTELNSPLGLELQLHITEAVCPALSEPGLRALLRFLTGFYVCLNRGDVNPNAQQGSLEAAGRTLVSVMVDHIFLCIKDAEFQLELLMQSLFFSRASVSDGASAKCLSRVMIGGLFLRDTFSRPPCTLIQPSIQEAAKSFLHIPDFGKDFCPPIYPLGDQQWQLNDRVPLVSLHSLQFKPSPRPPSFASQTVIDCQPLLIHLQEESCLRIASFLADGFVVNPDAVTLDFSVDFLQLNIKELDVTVPLDTGKAADIDKTTGQSSFTGARLHIENLSFSESPFLKLRLLNLEKDPACFCLWEGQPVDASQKKWTTEAAIISLSLETCNGSTAVQSSFSRSSELWRCVEVKGACIQVAMATADGSPLTDVPPPGGVVRIGVACEQYLSNTSVEQLFFVLDLYGYFGEVSEKITVVGKDKRMKERKDEASAGSLNEKVPGDTAVSLAVKNLKLIFLESSSIDIQETPLVQFVGEALVVKVSHRTLGGAMAISSSLRWDSIEVDCADVDRNLSDKNDAVPSFTDSENGIQTAEVCPQLRAVFWVQNKRKIQSNHNADSDPFLNLSMVHVIPYSAKDMECHSLSVSACIAGVRLGGGMNYAEALLHRFGILGPDGGPGEGLSKGLDHLSAGPLSKLFKPSTLTIDESRASKSNCPSISDGSLENENHCTLMHLSTPDDLDISIELKDWLFALEGAETMSERWWFTNSDETDREERCWHTTFRSLQVKANSTQKDLVNGKGRLHNTRKYSVEVVTVCVEGLEILKPQSRKCSLPNGVTAKGHKQTIETQGGINFEVDVVITEDNIADGMVKWVVENLKLSVKQPIEAIVTKDELQYLAILCKSEVDSMGRITAGVLRLLKLEGSVGQAAIDQLSNLGSERFDKVFSPDSLSRGIGSIEGSQSSSMTAESPKGSLESTVASLEVAILDSQTRCEALSTALKGSESAKQHADDVKQLAQKLESMQKLLARLRNQI